MDKNTKNESATELIERLERETGQRVDDPNSAAMDGLFGAMSRMMGASPRSYTSRDDVASGTLLQHQVSPAGRAEKASKEMLAAMLAGGMSPDDISILLGKK